MSSHYDLRAAMIMRVFIRAGWVLTCNRLEPLEVAAAGPACGSACGSAGDGSAFSVTRSSSLVLFPIAHEQIAGILVWFVVPAAASRSYAYSTSSAGLSCAPAQVAIAPGRPCLGLSRSAVLLH